MVIIIDCLIRRHHVALVGRSCRCDDDHWVGVAPASGPRGDRGRWEIGIARRTGASATLVALKINDRGQVRFMVLN